MKLYDEIIQEILDMVSSCEVTNIPVVDQVDWADLGNNNMVLRSEMAYELGGQGLAAVGATAVTAKEEFVPKDEILLIGKDIHEIKEDTPYARIAIARVAEDSLGEGNTLYNAIKKIEYTRYHVNPEGFMMRISSISKRETARISQEAIDKGLTFEKVGNVMLQSFHENPKIQAVKLIFVNIQDFPYEMLSEQSNKAEKITKTIDHMLKNIVMDCDVCSLQEICDEVEGLRELHFAEGATEAQE